MLVYKVYEFYQALEEDDLSLFYLGDVNDSITEKLIALNDNRLAEHAAGGKAGRKIAFLIAECFQNVIRHQEPAQSAQAEGQKSTSMFMVRHVDHQYTIASVNLVPNERVVPLQEKLRNLSRLGTSELKKMYLEVLPGDFSTKGGAGLGLIEMARRTGQQFQFDFEHQDDARSLFFFQLHLKEAGSSKQELLPLTVTQRLYNNLLEENILLLYKSDFSQSAMLPVLDMIEHNMREQGPSMFRYKAVLYVLVELFQNIMKHGAAWHGRQEGVLTICRSQGHYLICAGNFIAQDKIPQLRQHLLQINGLDKGGLQQLYKQELRNSPGSLKGGAGLGLIETGRYSASSFDFSFVTVDDHHSFFTLSTTI